MKQQIKLVIESDRISAQDLAKILDSLDKSFKAFVSRNGGRALKAQLAVSAIHHGSIEVIIDAIAAAGKLIEAGQYLAPFATHLSQIIGYTASSKSEAQNIMIVPADRKAVEALANPVAMGNASQINIVNNGKIVLSIDTADRANAVVNMIKSNREFETMNKYINQAETGENPVDVPRISATQVFALEHGKLIGSAFLVDGTWYARLDGGYGVLVPISAREDIISSLITGHAYAFRGRPMTGAKGETIGIFVEKAIRLE